MDSMDNARTLDDMSGSDDGNDSKTNIVLIGMPGAGKSTLGVVLAKLLQMDFVDADLLIQREYGASLSELIEREGSAAFIGMEARVLNALDPKDTVIATGGSAVYSDDAMEHLRSIGHVIYLDVDEKELEERLGDLIERGVVIRSGRSASLSDLLDERTPLYERYGDITVNTSGKTITQAAYDAAEQVAPLLASDDGDDRRPADIPSPTM